MVHQNPKMPETRAQDLPALEAFLLQVPATHPVEQWRIAGLDIWPLFVTTLAGLALHCRMNYQRHRTRVGSTAWKAGILGDHLAISPLRKRLSGRTPPPLPPADTDTDILLVGARGHGRQTGDLFLIPPLDVPAIELHRHGYASTGWLIDVGAGDPLCERCLTSPFRGIAELLAHAQRNSHRPRTGKELARLPGFLQTASQVRRFFPFSPLFLKIWFARQVNMALAARTAFSLALEQGPRPRALITLAAGYWWSTGLIAAARQAGVTTLEMEHGARRPSAISNPAWKTDFSRFNTNPHALISWSSMPDARPRILLAGPPGLKLEPLLNAPHPDDPSTYARAARIISEQQDELDRIATGRQRHVLFSSEDGIPHQWIIDIARHLPPDIFCWIRLHPGEMHRPLPDLAPLDTNNYDIRAASRALLPILLSRIDLHVTRHSGLTLECAAMDIPTLATHPYARELFETEVPPGLLHVRTDPQDAAHHIAATPSRADTSRKVAPCPTNSIADFVTKQMERMNERR